MLISLTIRPYVFGMVDCLDVGVIAGLVSDWSICSVFAERGKRKEISLPCGRDYSVRTFFAYHKRSGNTLGRHDVLTVLDRYRTFASDFIYCYSSMTMAVSTGFERLQVAFLL